VRIAARHAHDIPPDYYELRWNYPKGSPVKLDEIVSRLQAWSRDAYGAGAQIDAARFLGGHSGLTIGFDVILPDGGADRLVLKMPPPGAAAKDNFDVVRQVPLLNVLTAHGIPAPQVRWYSDDVSVFGGPYLMTCRLPGAPLPDVFGPNAGIGVVDVPNLFNDAVANLVKIHAIDGVTELADWSSPRLVHDEIEHWVRVLHKSTNADWTRKGMALRDLLKRKAPARCTIGIVHGDFYSNNWLFRNGRLSGIVDWEGTSVGPILLDLGWLCMMYDEESWGPIRRTSMNWHPRPASFISRYSELSQVNLADLPFYRGLAGYRVACLTAYYYELHRKGKRNNPAWEVFAEAFPFIIDRSIALVTRDSARLGATGIC
jgi:aminoglycoside phosphotransferase (APT) family kinase protein